MLLVLFAFEDPEMNGKVLVPVMFEFEVSGKYWLACIT